MSSTDLSLGSGKTVDPRLNRKKTIEKIKRNLISSSFVLPFLFFCIIFSIYPIIRIVLLSFQGGSVLGSDLKWVGFQNYISVFTNKLYYGAFINNLWFLILMIPYEQVMSLFLALLLRRKTSINAIFETIIFFPLLISSVAAGVIILYVLSGSGPANYLLSFIGVKGLNWMGDPFLAKISVVILEEWKGMTFYTFIYMAALRGIPKEYIEVAEIDGAKALKKLYYVTLPLIKNTIMLCVVMTTIWSFQIFDSIYIMTGGGPLKSTETIIFNVYKTTFQLNNMGLGAALAIIFLFIILLVSLIQMKFLKSDYEY